MEKVNHPCNLFASYREQAILYPKGSVIFMEGEPITGIHFIWDGRIKLSKTEEDGKEIIIRLATDGELLGQRCFFSRNTYGMSAVAIIDTKVTFIYRADLMQMLGNNHDLTNFVLKTFGNEMAESDRKLSSLMRKNVGQRLAEFILQMNKHFGSLKDTLPRIDLSLSREEIASCIGTSPETVTRYISIFKRRGMIKEIDHMLYVLKEDELQRFSSQEN